MPGGGNDDDTSGFKRRRKFGGLDGPQDGSGGGTGDLDDPDALEAARQYTQPALRAERTARPEVRRRPAPKPRITARIPIGHGGQTLRTATPPSDRPKDRRTHNTNP